MPTIRANADYITMINYFTVEPRDQAALMQVQMEDIDLYGRKQPAMRAASFHRSRRGDRVFNYAHWASLEGLGEWRRSADFAAHLERMRPFRFEVDPHPYQIVALSPDAGAPRIGVEAPPVPSLTMYYTEATNQAAVSDRLRATLAARGAGRPAGHRASWLAVSRDGLRCAEYAQWDSADAYDAYRASPDARELDAAIGALGARIESDLYAVGSTGYKHD